MFAVKRENRNLEIPKRRRRKRRRKEDRPSCLLLLKEEKEKGQVNNALCKGKGKGTGSIDIGTMAMNHRHDPGGRVIVWCRASTLSKKLHLLRKL